MRKRIAALTALAAALALFTAGCSGGQEPKGGFQPDFTTGLRTWVEMAVVEDGYFAVLMNDLAFYVDKSTLDYTVFCADPTCQHRFGNCLARRIGAAVYAIQVYDGELYFVNWDSETGSGWDDILQAVKTDGTGLRDVRTFFDQSKDRWPDEQPGSHFQYPYAILNGQIVFCPRSSVVCVSGIDEPIEDARVLFTYNTHRPTMIDGSEAHWDVWVDEGCFYYCGLNYPGGEMKGAASWLLYRYDPKTEENTLIWRSDEMAGTHELNGWYLKDGVFYYYVVPQPYEEVETGLFKCDLSTGETVRLSDCQKGTWAEYDSQYIYLIDYDAGAITVLSLETGAEVTVLDLTAALAADGLDLQHGDGFYPDVSIPGADETYLFVKCNVEDSETGESRCALYAVEKERFPEGVWHQVILYNWHDFNTD